MTIASRGTGGRILVTGSRDWRDGKAVFDALDCEYVRLGRPLVVVHGDCRTGADAFAHEWAVCLQVIGFDIREEPHPADWNRHGRAAGPIRNAEMVKLGADVCLAFIRNGSRGASGTAALAEAAGIPVRRWTNDDAEIEGTAS